MSKLDELIVELCPDGVQSDSLGIYCNISKGKQLNKDKLLEKGNYPAYNGGVSYSGFTNDYNVEENTTIISQGGASAGFVQFITTKFWANAHCYYLKPDLKVLNNRYVFHFVKNMQNKLMECQHGAGIPALKSDEIAKLQIPLPPLPVQNEIVRILDNFTELTAELTVELLKRREQYRHYSTVLFDDAKNSGVYSIEEVCHIEKGKTPIQKAIPGGYPMVVTTTERKSCDTYQFDAKAVCVPLVSSRGHGVASLNHVYYQEGKFALGNILCAIIPKNEEQVNPKYLYYYFEQTKDYTLVPLMKGGANVALHMNDVKKVKVPIPSLEDQKRIVDILEHFETLCNDITTGLPAEIEARKKQYEYYRDKLLTFKGIS